MSGGEQNDFLFRGGGGGGGMMMMEDVLDVANICH